MLYVMLHVNSTAYSILLRRSVTLRSPVGGFPVLALIFASSRMRHPPFLVHTASGIRTYLFIFVHYTDVPFGGASTAGAFKNKLIHMHISHPHTCAHIVCVPTSEIIQAQQFPLAPRQAVGSTDPDPNMALALMTLLLVTMTVLRRRCRHERGSETRTQVVLFFSLVLLRMLRTKRPPPLPSSSLRGNLAVSGFCAFSLYVPGTLVIPLQPTHFITVMITATRTAVCISQSGAEVEQLAYYQRNYHRSNGRC